MRREERFVSDFWFFFLLDDVLTDGARGCDLVGGCVGLVWFEEDGHSVDVSKRT